MMMHGLANFKHVDCVSPDMPPATFSRMYRRYRLLNGRWTARRKMKPVRSLNCLGLRDGARRCQLQDLQVQKIDRKSPMFGCKRFKW